MMLNVNNSLVAEDIIEGEFLNERLMEVSHTDNLSDRSAEDHVIEESVVDNVIYAGMNDEGTDGDFISSNMMNNESNYMDSDVGCSYNDEQGGSDASSFYTLNKKVFLKQ